MSRNDFTCCAVLLLAATLSSAAAADWVPASELQGRAVETRDGESLGRVHDFAIDVETGRIHYVVVSIGSFLIEDSLIAVDPAALRASAGPERILVLERDADALRSARRFGDANWPEAADVTAAAANGDTADAGAAPAPDGRGTATISSGSRTATLAAGERRIEISGTEPAAAAAEPAAGDDAGTEADSPGDLPEEFARLDDDGDRALDRSEIAHEMQRGDRYADIDTDSDGTVDPEEFAAWRSRRESAGD